MGTDIHGVWQKRTQTGWQDIPSKYKQERHYSLFAVLADVRNGYGFAGIRTGEFVKPIAEPRGLPSDFEVVDDFHPITDVTCTSREWELDDMSVWMGDHSFSWLTGSEMLAWTESAPVVVKTGILEREVYDRWDGESTPDGWCGGISGRDVITVRDSEEEKRRQPNWTHIECEWDSDLKQDLAYFFDEVARLVSDHGEIRFVFGFDN